MEKILKELYESPISQVFEVKQESTFCSIPSEAEGNPTYRGFKEEESW